MGLKKICNHHFYLVIENREFFHHCRKCKEVLNQDLVESMLILVREAKKMRKYVLKHGLGLTEDFDKVIADLAFTHDQMELVEVTMEMEAAGHV